MPPPVEDQYFLKNRRMWRCKGCGWQFSVTSDNRAEIGTHHHIAGPYLNSYADEMAWREDNRRKSNGAQYLNVVSTGLRRPVSRQWKGYWQRHLTKEAAE